MRHLQDEELLLFVDGEMKSRAAGEVRSHLETCWQCRVELQEVQDTVGECVRYRKNVLQCHLPPPPAPWNDIYRQLNEIDASLEPAFFQRFWQLLQWPVESARRWVPVAAALLVLGVLFYQYRHTPSVHAAELLRKAVAAEDARVVKPRVLEIRTPGHRFTRPSGRAVTTAAESAELKAVQALFVAANYDWENPLSAKSYQAWRDRLPAKRDEVTEESNAYRVRTETSSGELMAATLTLSGRELKPTQEKLEFRNQEWVEISEIAVVTVPGQAVAAARRDESNLPAKEVPSGVPAIPAPVAEATAGDELHAFAALHGVGADLGDPVEISRSGGKVVVSGVGIAAQRQQQIEGALATQPNVQVRFSESAPTKASPRRLPTSNTASADIQQLQNRIANRLGGRASFEDLSSQVLDMSEPMMARAYALRRLAEQFPVEAESQLSGSDRQILGRLREEHTTALRQQVAGLERLLQPLAAITSAGSVAAEPSASGGTWQSTTEELFQTARRTDKLISIVFGSAPGESSVEQLPAQLLSSLASLHARLEAYNRIEK